IRNLERPAGEAGKVLAEGASFPRGRRPPPEQKPEQVGPATAAVDREVPHPVPRVAAAAKREIPCQRAHGEPPPCAGVVEALQQQPRGLITARPGEPEQASPHLEQIVPYKPLLAGEP